MSFGLREQSFQAAINFFAQRGYWHHVSLEVKQGLKKLGNDPVMHFWNYVSDTMQPSRLQSGIRGLKEQKSNRDVSVAAIIALMQAHKRETVVDKDAIKDLSAELKAALKESGETALLLGALYFWHSGKSDKARDLVDKLLKLNGQSADGLALRGWIDVTSGRDSHAKKSHKYFEEALKQSNDRADYTHLDALLGKAVYFNTVKKDHKEALALLVRAVALLPNFVPALIMKAETEMAIGNWEGCLDSIERCLAVNDNCIPAHYLRAIYTLARTGNYDEAAASLGQLTNALDTNESENHALYFKLAGAPARLSGRNQLVLQHTRTLIDRAIKLDDTIADYHSEMAYQQLLRNHQNQALKLYKKAMDMNESSMVAIHGYIHCQILVGKFDFPRAQLAFLTDLQSDGDIPSEVLYLQALLASKENEPLATVVGHLDQALLAHKKAISGKTVSPDYFLTFDPELLLSIANLYLQYTPTEPPQKGDAPSPLLEKVMSALELVVKLLPGCIEASYLLARVRYLSGDATSALSGAQHCTKLNNSYVPGHLLLAEIHLALGNVITASQVLQTGLSYNFEIRDNPMYHVIQAKIHNESGAFKDAKKSLMAALKLPGIRNGGKEAKLSDRVTVFLALADVNFRLDRPTDAKKVLTEASNQFGNTPESVRVTIASADLLVRSGEVEPALDLLRGVSKDEPYYVQAKEKMAQVYLKYRKDKRVYISCYKELVEQSPSAHTHLLLGDAYMSIQEPASAISVYRAALKENPRDSAIASKIGTALVRTHDYSKAIAYYESAVKNGGQPQLRAALAELHLKLNNYDKARKVLEEAMGSSIDSGLEGMILSVSHHKMLAKLQKQNEPDRLSPAIETLKIASKLQGDVITKTTVEQPESLKLQQLVAADVCFELAKLYEADPSTYNEAVNAYSDALRYDSASSKAMLALAKLHLSQGHPDLAQFQLSSLLQQGGMDDKDQGDAAMMMAEIMFRKHEYDSATFHIQQLLDKQPLHFEALTRLIDLNRRAGKLDQCERYIKLAEAASDRADSEPGLNYCKGLVLRYQHRPNDAILALNKARRDNEFGEKAVIHMIEICLNPAGDTIGGSDASSADGSSDAIQMGVKTAGKLLAEIKEDNAKIELLRYYALMATKSKHDIEAALAKFAEFLQQRRDDIGGILGLARAYMLLRNTPKARHQLKRVQKMTWNANEAEEFEGAWLLLAKMYIDNGKMDLATDLLKQVLKHNKGCSKAWEYMGGIMEKEQAYANAAEFYENAWQFSSGSDAAVGYKLAFNYLKARRLVDAIDICHKVLAVDPKYPRIKKDILDKARAQIRT